MTAGELGSRVVVSGEEKDGAARLPACLWWVGGGDNSGTSRDGRRERLRGTGCLERAGRLCWLLLRINGFWVV